MAKWLLVSLTLSLLALPLLSTAASGAASWDIPTGPNLLANAGFEDLTDGRPTGWTGDPAVYTSDADTVFGEHSLKYVNADPARYALCSQSIDPRVVVAGRKYEISARVKTQGVTGEDTGASICLEWYDAQGKYLGGTYPDGRKGDTGGWVEVRAVTPPIPAAAATFSLSCYLRKGTTGTAWWDDVSVRRWKQKPMETTLLSPSYRGLLGADAKDVRVRVNVLYQELDYLPEALRVNFSLAPADGGATLFAKGAPLSGPQFDFALPLKPLEPGDYVLSVSLERVSERKPLCQDSYRLARRSGPAPRSYVDAHNRLIVNGKPFLPLGMYWGGVSEEELNVYRDSPFNCLMPYGAPTMEQLDLIQRMGLKAFYSIKDDYYGTEWCPKTIASEADEEKVVRDTVRQFRDHPALLAWYINDERPLEMCDRLEAHQRWVEEEDPNHPTWAVLYQVDELPGYARTFDVLGSDPYPIPNSPAAVAGTWARKTRDSVGGARAVWMVPQVFRWPEATRPPSLEELRSMTWQCLAEGATGLIFYAWFELRADQKFAFAQRWPEVKQVAQEVKDMEPVLHSIEPSPAITVAAPDTVHWTVRTYQGTAYLILANGDNAPVKAKVSLPRAARKVTLDGKPIAGKRGFEAALPALGVSIYRLVF